MYSDNACTALKESLPFYPGGMGSFDLTFHKCWSPTPGMGLKVVMCEPGDFVALRYYTDSSCVAKSTPPIQGFAEGYCQMVGDGTYIKVLDMTLKGNRYGIGWTEGWSIFLCQTVLFGVCQGY